MEEIESAFEILEEIIDDRFEGLTNKFSQIDSKETEFILDQLRALKEQQVKVKELKGEMINSSVFTDYYTLGYDFTNTKPRCFELGDHMVSVSQWNELTEKLLKLLYNKHGEDFIKSVEEIGGFKRDYFSKDKSDLNRPVTITDGFYAETSFSTNGINTVIKNVFDKMDYDYSELKIYLRR